MKKVEFFKKGVKVFYHRLFNINCPLFVGFNVTRKCNLNCPYCYISKKKEGELSTDDAVKLIRLFSQHGTQKFTLVGGEPLLREDIGRLIEVCKEENLYTMMTTNGTLIKKKIDALKKLDFLNISLNEFNSPVFKKSLNSLKIAKNASIRTVASIILTKNNAKNIVNILDICNDIGIPLVVTPFLEKFDNANMKKYRPNKEEYDKAVDNLVLAKKKGKKIFNSFSYLNKIKRYPSNYVEKRCLAGKFSCHVDNNGDIYPCVASLDKIRPYNLLKDGFEKAFYNMPKFSCKSCYWNCNLELNDLLSFNFEELMNLIRQVGWYQ